MFEPFSKHDTFRWTLLPISILCHAASEHMEQWVRSPCRPVRSGSAVRVVSLFQFCPSAHTISSFSSTRNPSGTIRGVTCSWYMTLIVKNRWPRQGQHSPEPCYLVIQYVRGSVCRASHNSWTICAKATKLSRTRLKLVLPLCADTTSTAILASDVTGSLLIENVYVSSTLLRFASSE